ncbi:MAG: arginine deiminase family protein [Candidatus Micrarchaeia archaeon]
MAGIKAEWDTLRKLSVHRPGIEMYFGLLSPEESLYERAFDMSKAQWEHDMLRHILRHEFKIEVTRLENTIIEAAERDPKIRQKLVKLGMESMHFVGDSSQVSITKKEIEENESVYNPSFFLTSAIMHPTIHLEKTDAEKKVSINVSEHNPLSNLYFMRDQQAVTDKGIVMSRMSKPQRSGEPKLTKFLWEIMNEKIAYEIQPEATFEGGDFIPMKDFALLGNGDRTNNEGVKQMLAKGLDFDEVGVVHQPNHPLIPSEKPDPMIDMHLDTYFNVASSNTVIGSGLLLKRARVDIYIKQEKGKYKKVPKTTNLYDYIKSKGFNVISLTTLEQMSYASNFLAVKDGTIIAIDVSRIVRKVLEDLEFKAKINPYMYKALFMEAKKDYEILKSSGEFFPSKHTIYQNGIDAYMINVTNLTGGYGGAHCMTAALKRG